MKKILQLICLCLMLHSCSKEKRADTAAAKMQDFVVNISQYAREYNKDFIIIPQNGLELSFNNADPGEGLKLSYLAAIDGFGVEELFYNGSYNPDNERLTLLDQLGPLKKILVSEFISDINEVNNAINLNLNKGFLCFARVPGNYDYSVIPESLIEENKADIISLSDARNYLYLISAEKFSSKTEMIHAASATNFDVIIIDLFFDGEVFTETEVNQLKLKANGGKRLVISYINIGSAENFRYYWKPDWKLHHPDWIEKKYEGYPDEFWVQFWDEEWQKIIFGNDDSYIKKILDAGFDGAYLDNVEAYYFLFYDE